MDKQLNQGCGRNNKTVHSTNAGLDPCLPETFNKGSKIVQLFSEGGARAGRANSSIWAVVEIQMNKNVL